MQIEGTSASGVATSGIHFGSDSRTATSTVVEQTEKQLNYIYREVLKFQKALDSIKDEFRLRSDREDNLVMSKTRAGRIADLFKDAADSLNNLFDDKKVDTSISSDIEDFVSELRDSLESAVSEAFDSTNSTIATDYGITFDFGVSARRVVDMTSLDRNDFIRQLTSDGETVNELFYGKKSSDKDGLLEKLSKALGITASDLKDILGTSGVFVNTTV
ncbi:MAG: hypothetical protein AB1499_16315 [Nitrospirota bacterium]